MDVSTIINLSRKQSNTPVSQISDTDYLKPYVQTRQYLIDTGAAVGEDVIADEEEAPETAEDAASAGVTDGAGGSETDASDEDSVAEDPVSITDNGADTDKDQ